MGFDFTTKQGDSGGTLATQIVDISGNPVNLTGGSVTFVARQLTANAPAVSAAGTLVTPATGQVSYTLLATDTKVAGLYLVEWHWTNGSGITGTFPVDGYQEWSIEENLTTAGGARIVSLGEAKDYLNINTTDRARDAKLLRLIDGLTPVVEGITGPVLQTPYTAEPYEGGMSFISLRHRPVIEVQQVVEYRGPIAYNLTQVQTPDLGTIYSYTFEPPGRIIRRTVGGGVTPFPPGYGQVEVTYIAGFQTVPKNIRDGMLELVRVNFRDTQQGRPRVGAGGADAADEDLRGTVVQGFLVPNRTREYLSPRKRHPSLA